MRENIMLALLEQRAVTQSEGDSLGHAPTATRLAEAKRLGSARVVILRDPVVRLMSRYWFEGRWEQSSRGPKTDATARSFEDWLDIIRSRERRGGTRLWQCTSNYYVRTLAGCGGAGVACAGDGEVGEVELAAAKAALAADFSLVLLTEWLGSEGQGRLLAKSLCFEWPRPVLRVPRGIAAGEWRAIPEFSPKRYSGKGIPEDWAAGVSPSTFRRLTLDNELDYRLFHWAADLVRGRVRSAAGPAAAATLPQLNATKLSG